MEGWLRTRRHGIPWRFPIPNRTQHCLKLPSSLQFKSLHVVLYLSNLLPVISICSLWSLEVLFKCAVTGLIIMAIIVDRNPFLQRHLSYCHQVTIIIIPIFMLCCCHCLGNDFCLLLWWYVVFIICRPTSKELYVVTLLTAFLLWPAKVVLVVSCAKPNYLICGHLTFRSFLRRHQSITAPLCRWHPLPSFRAFSWWMAGRWSGIGDYQQEKNCIRYLSSLNSWVFL